MNLYQLGEYNTRSDLSLQVLSIRNHVLTNQDYSSLKQLIESFETLESESIIILKRAILAGYSTSYYGFGWTAEQETTFWELVNQKSPESGVAILTLAQSYRANQVKSFEEVLDLYFKAFSIDLEHFYSVDPEEMELIRRHDKWKYQFIKIELDNYERIWSRADFEEELPYFIERCYGDIEMIDYVENRIREILKYK